MYMLAGPLCSHAPCSWAWRSFVGPVGTTQGAGSVTAVSTYIMWLMAVITIVEANSKSAQVQDLLTRH